MSFEIALLDANVLYPAPMRDLLLQLVVSNLFRARWSADIHREWIDALSRNEPHRDRAALERTRDLMDRAVRDCLVTGYEPLVPTLSLPDLRDRHVLAAAIAGQCDTIVTQNLQHFPDAVLTSFGITRYIPTISSATTSTLRQTRSATRSARYGLGLSIRHTASTSIWTPYGYRDWSPRWRDSSPSRRCSDDEV